MGKEIKLKYVKKIQQQEQKSKTTERKIKALKKVGGKRINGRIYTCVGAAKSMFEAKKIQKTAGHWTTITKTSKGFKVYKLAETV